MRTEHKPLDYSVGALATLVISVGSAAIVYAIGIIPFVLINLLAWIFGPLAVYTIIYSIVAGKESTYYVVWGTIMVAAAIISVVYYNMINIVAVIGILLIVLAVIGIIAYWRGGRK